VSPNTGSTLGGTAVPSRGRTSPRSHGDVGSTAATSVVVVSSTSITATTPAGKRRCGDSDGDRWRPKRSLANRVYVRGFSNGDQCNRRIAADAGGTAVTITGANFATGAAVTFGSDCCDQTLVVVSATQITANNSSGNAGAVTVTVTSQRAQRSLPVGSPNSAPPTVTGISPNSGLTAGGTAVTITGTSFATERP